MGRNRADRTKSCTYADYLNWAEDERWEIINGEAFAMTPGPGIAHQRILLRIADRFFQYLKNKPCEVFVAPIDVRLPNADEEDQNASSIVQPDIVVVCDPKQLDPRGIKGSPDLVVEIVSPSTASNDYVRKLRLYEAHKIREYWIVHPSDKTVIVFRLSDMDRFGDPKAFSELETVKVEIFPELEIDLKEIFVDSK